MICRVRLLLPAPLSNYGTQRVVTGLIVSVGQGGNSSDIELVKDLVITYISKPSCLILLTVTCESKATGSVLYLYADICTADFENQGAHTIAKQHDPEGKRTIGMFAFAFLETSIELLQVF